MVVRDASFPVPVASRQGDRRASSRQQYGRRLIRPPAISGAGSIKIGPFGTCSLPG
jgi:hypothetical protein